MGMNKNALPKVYQEKHLVREEFCGNSVITCVP